MEFDCSETFKNGVKIPTVILRVNHIILAFFYEKYFINTQLIEFTNF